MRLVHYSDAIIDLILPRGSSKCEFKPKGLWVSDDDCEDNWRAWCISEGFRLDRLTYAHEIDIHSSAHLLILGNDPQLDDFTQLFSVPGKLSHDVGQIDWDRVKEQYDGLIISPYVWSQRLELMWYYSWDCASGCIWNPDIVKIKSVGKTEVKDCE
jgi:hypothetical protein